LILDFSLHSQLLIAVLVANFKFLGQVFTLKCIAQSGIQILVSGFKVTILYIEGQFIGIIHAVSDFIFDFHLAAFSKSFGKGNACLPRVSVSLSGSPLIEDFLPLSPILIIGVSGF